MLQSIILALGLGMGVPSEGAEPLKVNTTASTIKWEAAKVGGKHNGVIQLKEGSIDVNNGQIDGGSFVIDMTTIVCEDLTGEYKGKLEGHLKSDDFFGVDKYPTANFVIKNAVPQAPGTFKITGDITIKGITKEIKFPATLKETAKGTSALATITIDRSEFNVKYGSGSFFDNLGDKVIYDDFTLTVELVASK